MLRKRLRWGAWAGLTLLLVACGGGGGDGASDIGETDGRGSATSAPPPPGSNYFPLAVGDRWLYQESSNGKSTTFQVDVDATGTVNGRPGTDLLSTTLAGAPIDVSRYSSTARGVTVLPAEGDAFQSAVGPYMLLQLPAQPGDSFVQMDKTVDVGSDRDGDGVHERVSLRAAVQVIARNPLTTPAGAFSEALHLSTKIDQTLIFSRNGHRESVVVVSDDWYVADVGRVRSDLTVTSQGMLVSTTSTVLLAYRVGGAHGGAAPTVVNVAPGDSTVHNGAAAVTAGFSLPMDGVSLNAGGFTVLDAAGHSIAGSAVLTQDGLSATFVPAAGWPSGAYTATISSAATDRQGNAATPSSWHFTLDTVAPALVQATPADGATGVATTTKLSYVFSEPFDPSIWKPGQPPVFTITDDATGAAAPALPGFDGSSTISFTPLTYWPHGRSYTVTFPASMADVVGNPLGADRQVHFSTAPSLFADQVPIAATFGYQPQMAMGDINGDGLLDMVWASWDWPIVPSKLHLVVRYGRADGSWAPAVEPIEAPVYPCGVATIAIGDVNSNGRKDLVLGGHCGIQVLLQDTSGSFSKGPLYPLPGYDYGGVVKLVDLDGDGRLDMLTAGNSTAFRVWMQTSTGVFVETASIDTGIGSVTGLELGDLDSDGVLDIVASSAGMQENRLAVLRGRSGGGFSPPLGLPTGDGWPSGVAIGDLDDDGRPDLVVSIANGAIPRVVVLRQSVDRNFSVFATLPTSGNTIGVSLVDVDGNGRLDMVTGYDDALAVLLRRADGTFGAEDLYGVPRIDGLTSSMVVGPRNAQGQSAIEFNGQLFLPQALVTPSQIRSVQGPTKLYDRERVLSLVKR